MPIRATRRGRINQTGNRRLKNISLIHPKSHSPEMQKLKHTNVNKTISVMTKKVASARNKPVYKMSKDEFVDIDSARKIRKIVKYEDSILEQKGKTLYIAYN